MPTFSWDAVKSEINHPNLIITEGGRQERYSDFVKSKVGTKACADCITPVILADQIFEYCSALIRKDECFEHGHFAVGAGTVYSPFLSSAYPAQKWSVKVLDKEMCSADEFSLE